MSDPTYLKLNDGNRLAYHKTQGASAGVIFLGGFRSDMTGVKATALEAYCKKHGVSFVRFDYEGHGASGGVFEDSTIGIWLADSIEVLEKLTKGPQLLIGSSMGAWLALLVALAKPRRVAGIIGIASAPDFTEHLLWERLTEKQQGELKHKGKVLVPSDMGEPFVITERFIIEARRHLLLDKPIDVHCPVRLLHGMKDDDVPWEISLAINEKLATKDVKTILIEGGDHRLSEPSDIEKLLSVTAKMLTHCSGKKRTKHA